MNHLSYLQKFLLIGTVFILPISLLLFLFIREIDDRIDFARKERMGISFARPLHAMLFHVCRTHLEAINHSKGESDAGPAMQRTLAETDEKFRQVSANQRVSDNAMETGKGFKVLAENWSYLQQGLLADQLSNADELFAFVEADIRDLLAQIVHASNLNRDPDLDTYYLMDASVLKWPRIQGLLIQTSLLAGMARSRQALAATEKTAMAVLFADLRTFRREA